MFPNNLSGPNLFFDKKDRQPNEENRNQIAENTRPNYQVYQYAYPGIGLHPSYVPIQNQQVILHRNSLKLILFRYCYKCPVLLI